MGIEIDLLINYPKAKRDIKKRGTKKTEEDRKIAASNGGDSTCEFAGNVAGGITFRGQQEPDQHDPGQSGDTKELQDCH